MAGGARRRTPAGRRLERLQGRWSARVGPGNEIRVHLEIDGRRAKVVIATPQGLTIRARGRVQLDESTTPRSLDWAEFRSLDGQRLPDIPAIYRIDDHGWTVCNGGPQGTRPATFDPGDGLLAGVVTFQRTDRAAEDSRPRARPGRSHGRSDRPVGDVVRH